MGTSTSRTTTRSWRTFVTKDRLAFDRADYLGAKIIPGILRSTRAGEPFTRRNVMRLSAIALTVGIGGLLTQYAQGFANSAIYPTGRLPDRAGLSFEMTLTTLPLVVMLMVALIAEAFRRGVTLRDDVEGLV